MATEEEKRAFGIHKKYGVDISKPSKKEPIKSERGQLYYYGELIKEGKWALLQVEKRKLISTGFYNPRGFQLRNLK